MASEHMSLPGSSNVVVVSYKGTDPDVRRIRLVREKQSRETADRMERCQSSALDAFAWADAHRAQVRGRDRQIRRRGAAGEHPFIEEVRQAARQQTGQADSDWLDEPEPEPEQEPEPEPKKHPKEGRTQRGDNTDAVGTTNVGTRGHRGQLGRCNSRGARYQHVGQRGGLSQCD